MLVTCAKAHLVMSARQCVPLPLAKNYIVIHLRHWLGWGSILSAVMMGINTTRFNTTMVIATTSMQSRPHNLLSIVPFQITLLWWQPIALYQRWVVSNHNHSANNNNINHNPKLTSPPLSHNSSPQPPPQHKRQHISTIPPPAAVKTHATITFITFRPIVDLNPLGSLVRSKLVRAESKAGWDLLMRMKLGYSMMTNTTITIHLLIPCPKCTRSHVKTICNHNPIPPSPSIQLVTMSLAMTMMMITHWNSSMKTRY